MIGCAEYANYALAIRALSPIEEHDAADTSTRYGIAVIFRVMTDYRRCDQINEAIDRGCQASAGKFLSCHWPAGALTGVVGERGLASVVVADTPIHKSIELLGMHQNVHSAERED
jgi:hypothetical protein